MKTFSGELDAYVPKMNSQAEIHLNQAGKTAPRLLEDLLKYDPKNRRRDDYNSLTDLFPIDGSDETFNKDLHAEGCQHNYSLKFEQSFIPPIDTRADSTTAWKIAAICLLCRYHVDLIIDFRGRESYLNACPNKEYPLHHFIFEPSSLDLGREAEERDLIEPQPSSSHFQFHCTAGQCQAALLIQLHPPRLRNDQLRKLTDPDLLEARKKAAIEADPARFDEFQTAKPVEVLEVLNAYFRDSLDLTRPASRRRIPVRNRFFMLSFGSDCDNILEDLGFRYGVRMQFMVYIIVV